MIPQSKSHSSAARSDNQPIAIASTSSTTNLSITIVGAIGLPSVKLPLRAPSPFVKIVVANYPPRRTQVIKKSTAPIWNEEFFFVGLDATSELSFELLHDGYLAKISRNNKTLGRAAIQLRKLLELQQGKETVMLGLPIGSLIVRVHQGTDSSIAAGALAQLSQADKQAAHPDVLDTEVPDASAFPSLGTAVELPFSSTMASLAKLMKIADELATIHPYVNMAWQVVTSLYKVIRVQVARDDKILELVRTITSLYSFVDRLESLRKDVELDVLENIIQSILVQTVECSIFIREYLGYGFARRAIRDTLSSSDAKIADFQKRFADLAAHFDRGVSVATALISFRSNQGVERLVIAERLRPIKQEWSDRPLCLPKTRINIINFVTDWATRPPDDKSNLLYLFGVAGSGKSTLSTTIADNFYQLGRLGAFFFFDKQGNPPVVDPGVVVRSLAFQLALFDDQIGQAISNAIVQDPRIPDMVLSRQFQNLLQKPLQSAQALPDNGPIMVVIDALDECEHKYSREKLIALLAKEAVHLPSNVRIVVTSRAEPDIESAFKDESHILMQEVESANESDISTFIQHRLAKIAKKNDLVQWPRATDIDALVARAAGLFIWASTACEYVDEANPLERLGDLLNSDIRRNAEAALDALYVMALKSSGIWKDDRSRQNCCAIIGLILIAKKPLTFDEIDQLLSLKSKPFISRLRSVLHYTSQTDPIRIVHLSFQEFLTDPSRCKNGETEGPWLIQLALHRQQFAERCFERMGSVFHNDFCQLIVDKPSPVYNLDKDVTYTCKHWVEHVCECPGDFGSRLYNFLSKNILPWLEAMIMLKESRRAEEMLHQLHEWLKISQPSDVNLIDLAHDILHFAIFFNKTIAEHSALISLAVLPFAPIHPNVNIARHLLDSLYKVVQLQNDCDDKILELILTITSLYSFMDRLEILRKNVQPQVLDNIIESIQQQTFECSMFIREYLGHGFAGRSMHDTWLNTDAKIADFQNSFTDLEAHFDKGIYVNTALVSFRSRSDQDIKQLEALLRKLNPVNESWWLSRPLCLPKTGIDIINFVTDWATRPPNDKSNVLCLFGVAGSGKSTLSRTIADKFEQLKRLGGSFSFSVGHATHCVADNMVRTLASQLALFDVRIGNAAWDTIQNKPFMEMPLWEQFGDLLLKPFSSVTALSEEGPIVIVIDALDECTDNRAVVALLAKETAKLPKNIRVIITSRAHANISEDFHNKRHIRILDLSTFTDDITVFIQQRMATIARDGEPYLPVGWLGPAVISALVERAEGWYIWAECACRKIEDHWFLYGCSTPIDVFVTGRAVTEPLDRLYRQALHSAGDWDDATFIKARAILGVIVLVKDPVSPDILDTLLSVDSYLIISKLRSLLHIQNPTDPVRVVHTTFIDFLTDNQRCFDNRWFINQAYHEQNLVEYCIHTMNTALPNHFGHHAVVALQTGTKLDEGVVYACRFWIVHVCKVVECTESLRMSLCDFLAQNIGLWLKAMSMLKESRRAEQMLEELRNWLERLPENVDLIKFVDSRMSLAGRQPYP